MYCCMNCTDRHPGCHSECEIYISERAKFDERKEKIIKAKAKDEKVISTIIDLKARRRRNA